MRNVRCLTFLIAFFLLIIVTGCTKTSVAESLGTDETKAEDGPESPPELSLSDMLSSTLNYYQTQSGNYTWSYLNGEEITSMTACGQHPLETDPEKVEKLRVPQYNKLDSTPYLVSCNLSPDLITVREWDISQLGKTDAEETSVTEYQDGFIIDLKPGKVYEITAQWKEEKLESNRFFGEASYVVITD